MSLVFTGDEFIDGLDYIEKVLDKNNVKSSFFVTGRLLANDDAARTILRLYNKGHYIGPHSDQHLLYAPWENRDSLLISKDVFVKDLQDNIDKLTTLGIQNIDMFIPPYEWYNKQIVNWSKEMGLDVYNYTPGLRTPADYTYPEMNDRYWSSQKLLDQIKDFENIQQLNGYYILVHLGTDPRRYDKFYHRLDELIKFLRMQDYEIVELTKM